MRANPNAAPLHTPGPWHADGVNVGAAPGAVVDCSDGYGLMSFEEACANALLIAAAPDMRAALGPLA